MIIYIRTVSTGKEYDWYELVDGLGHKKEPPNISLLFDKEDKFVLSREEPSMALYKNNESFILILDGLYSDNRRAGSGLIFNSIAIENKFELNSTQKTLLFNFLCNSPLSLNVFPGIQTKELLDISNNIAIDENANFIFNLKRFTDIIQSIEMKEDRDLSSTILSSCSINDRLKNGRKLFQILEPFHPEEWLDNEIICLVSNRQFASDFKVSHHLSLYGMKSKAESALVDKKKSMPNPQKKMDERAEFSQTFKNDLTKQRHLAGKKIRFKRKLVFIGGGILIFSIILFILYLKYTQ